jgi:hypothetical protein
VKPIELLESIGVSAFGFFDSFGFIKAGRGGSSDGGLGGCDCFFERCNDVPLSKASDARELLPVVSGCKDWRYLWKTLKSLRRRVEQQPWPHPDYRKSWT